MGTGLAKFEIMASCERCLPLRGSLGRARAADTGGSAPTVHGRTAWLRFWPKKERIENDDDNDNDNDWGKDRVKVYVGS